MPFCPWFVKLFVFVFIAFQFCGGDVSEIRDDLLVNRQHLVAIDIEEVEGLSDGSVAAALVDDGLYDGQFLFKEFYDVICAIVFYTYEIHQVHVEGLSLVKL